MRNLKTFLFAGAALALAAPGIAAAQTATTGAAMATERGAQGAAARDAANFDKAMLGVGKAYKAPRNAFGQPDLQGFWNNSTLTGLERAASFGDRREYTDEEAAKIEGTEVQFYADKAKPVDPNIPLKDLLAMDCGKGLTGAGCGYDAGWIDPGTRLARVNGKPRTSFITSTPNGRIPAMKPEAQQRMQGRRRTGTGPADNPEQRSLGDRCITSWANHAGPIMMPSTYNNNYQFVQSRDTIAIVSEVVHDTRIIRMNSTHGPSAIRPWFGDSIGRWEGDTLVVETINYNPNQSFRGSDENLKVIEKFTRVGPTRMLYQFEVDNQTVWDTKWGGEYEFVTGDQLYEFACHEGNYALEGILRGERQIEAAALAKAQASGTGPAAGAQRVFEEESEDTDRGPR